MADWYWFNDKVGAAGDGKFESNNWNAAIDASGAWGTPGAGDTAFMEHDYGGGAGGCDDNCTLDADVTITYLFQNLPAGDPYQGTFTVAVGRTLTVTSCELESAFVHTGSFVCTGNDFQTFATHTGAGSITADSGIIMSAGTDWSGYTGTFTWNGGGAEDLELSAGTSLPDFVVNGAGALTATGVARAGDVTMTAGTFNVLHGLTCDDVGVDGGTFNWGGSIVLGDLAGTGGTLTLGSSYVQPGDTKTLDFANITVTNTACHIVTANGTTADVQNTPAAITPKIHCHGLTDDTGGLDPNDAGSIDFDEYACPGSFATLGVGV